MKTILVTGATGRVGRHVVAQLLAEGVRVRALARTPETAGLPAEVEVVPGDLTVPNTLDRSTDGVDAVFLVWAASGATAAASIERLTRGGAKIVLLTSPHQTPHPFFRQPNPMATLHANIERIVDATGVRRTFLRPGMFAANVLWWWAPQLRAGDVVRWPYADAPTAPIDERDIAAVAVRTLLDAAHDGAEYVLTGPQSLTQREQVTIIGEVLGRTVRFEELSPDEARSELKFPPAAMDMLLNAWSAALGLPAYVTTAVEEITGRPARTFREWVAEHADEFRRLEDL